MGNYDSPKPDIEMVWDFTQIAHKNAKRALINSEACLSILEQVYSKVFDIPISDVANLIDLKKAEAKDALELEIFQKMRSNIQQMKETSEKLDDLGYSGNTGKPQQDL